jgi:AcrR family transcriptional regulator
MPRLPRKKEEIEKIRELILDNALEIINSEGYDSLTMRRLGDTLGCSAKTIYNYYCSKEEIYLKVLTRGFEKINGIVDKALEGITDPVEKLRIMSKVYIQFGLDNVHYYNIMFNWDVPKYTSYINTPLEEVAREEKDTAMHYADLSESAISEILKVNGKFSEEDVSYHLIRMWSELHGFVSMHNSHGFQEYDANPIRFENRIIEAMLSELLQDK